MGLGRGWRAQEQPQLRLVSLPLMVVMKVKKTGSVGIGHQENEEFERSGNASVKAISSSHAMAVFARGLSRRNI